MYHFLLCRTTARTCLKVINFCDVGLVLYVMLRPSQSYLHRSVFTGGKTPRQKNHCSKRVGTVAGIVAMTTAVINKKIRAKLPQNLCFIWRRQSGSEPYQNRLHMLDKKTLKQSVRLYRISLVTSYEVFIYIL